MKIAFMMRAIDQDNSFGVFTGNLLRTLLKMDRTNSYLLLYKEPKHFGRFANFANVKELLLPSRHKLFWDQFHRASGSMARACGHHLQSQVQCSIVQPLSCSHGTTRTGVVGHP